MTLNNKIKQSGFTIVELLIVIVVIAILAAITIVAYNGIQNRAKNSAAQALSNNVTKKAEAYNTIQSIYATNTELKNNYKTGTTTVSTDTESQLDTTTAAAIQVANPTDEKAIGYTKCITPAGAKVVYWQTSGLVTTYLGQATSASTCTA